MKGRKRGNTPHQTNIDKNCEFTQSYLLQHWITRSDNKNYIKYNILCEWYFLFRYADFRYGASHSTYE